MNRLAKLWPEILVGLVLLTLVCGGIAAFVTGPPLDGRATMSNQSLAHDEAKLEKQVAEQSRAIEKLQREVAALQRARQ